MAESRLVPSAASGTGARGLMQLMPSTFREVASRNPEFHSIDDPTWNIAAGICYDRQLWNLWSDPLIHEERVRFVLGSYNAGRGTLLRARELALGRRLDGGQWASIRLVASKVPRWRHVETLGYVDRVETNLQWLCLPPLGTPRGAIPAPPPSAHAPPGRPASTSPKAAAPPR